MCMFPWGVIFWPSFLTSLQQKSTYRPRHSFHLLARSTIRAGSTHYRCAWMMLCDVSMAVWICYSGIMVYCLHKSRTQFHQMNRVLVRLTAVAIQTGTFCTVFAMGDLFAFRKTFEVVMLYTDIVLSRRHNARNQSLGCVCLSDWAHIHKRECLLFVSRPRWWSFWMFKTLMLTLNMREELRDMLGEPRIVCFHFFLLISRLWHKALWRQILGLIRRN